MWFKNQLLKKRSRPLVAVSGLIFVLLVGLVDYLSGLEISLAILYLLPIFAVAWFSGRWPGIVIALAAGFVWFLADLASERKFSHEWVPYFNLVSRAGAFVAVGAIVGAMRDLADTLEQRVYERTNEL